MSSIIKPKTDIMLRSSTEVDNICNPLKKVGIQFFSHTRIFEDGSRIDLNNNPDMISEFYYGKEEMYRDYTPEIDPHDSDANLLFLDSLHNNKSIQFLREGYKIDHMAVEILKKDGYCDVFNFGTTPENNAFYADFMQNKDVIDVFKKYYFDKANDLIKKFSTDRIVIIGDNDGEKSTKNGIEHKCSSWDSARKELYKYHNEVLSNKFNLTEAEKKCCTLLLKGLSRNEIADALYRSPRTIDAHLQSVKKKLGCKNLNQMICKLNLINFEL